MAGELYGDFSRIATIGPGVSGLLAQQGRVVLDSDLNAQNAVVMGQLRTMFVDLVGPAAGPAGALGFEIKAEKVAGELVLTAGPGRYYVDGMLCQVDAVTSYFEQGAFLDEDEDELPALPFVVYLKVWERTISAIEDPSSREVALGSNGPDTATRSQVVWQFLTTRDVFGQLQDAQDLTKPEAQAKQSAMNAWGAWDKLRSDSRGTLMARAARPEEADDEPCPVPPASAYRGLENQLYRVEVHRVEIPEGEDLPTAVEIKWSRVNGSATYPIETFGEDGKVVTLATLGRDRGLMIDVGDYVEVVDDRYVLYPGDDPLRRTTNPLLRVMDVEPLDRTVTLSATSEDVGHVASRHPFLRRWDHQAGPGRPKIGDGGALDVQLLDTEPTASGPGPKESDWVDLEDGVQVKITQGRLRPGDYWLIPARTETGDVEWPGDPADPAALPPMGVDYSFAPLAIVRGENDVVSLRVEFSPLAG